MIKRREFMSAVGGLLAFPAIGRAQTNRIAHIAYLGATSPSVIDPRQIEQFKTGLAENGLGAGRNSTVESSCGEGSLQRMRRLAGERAKRDLDVIVTAGGQAVGALTDAHVRTPIVFAIWGDPTGSGIVKSLAHPGGNLTGLSMANAHLE